MAEDKRFHLGEIKEEINMEKNIESIYTSEFRH